MTDQTPLEALDDAVRAFAEQTGRKGAVGGWALAYDTSWVHNDDDGTLPLVHGTNYVLGPATSMTTAIGLGRAITAVAETHLTTALMADDDEEDEL